MARVNNLTAFLTDVAAAIKEKKGDNTDILAADFDTEIIGITTGHLDDEEYEEANNITDEILNGVDVITIYPPDWSEIGYNDTPQFILDAFAYAEKIKQEWDPNNPKNFRENGNLIICPVLDVSKKPDMSFMFYNCQNLQSVPLLNVSSATNLSYMFYTCPSLSNESLNNILSMCTTATKIASSNKTLKYLGLTQAQATTCQSLSNYQAFIDAGWTTGY